MSIRGALEASRLHRQRPSDMRFPEAGLAKGSRGHVSSKSVDLTRCQGWSKFRLATNFSSETKLL